MSRTAVITILSAAGVALAGSAAVAANVGILDSVGNDVGALEVTATVPTTLPITTTVAATTTSVSATPGAKEGEQVFTLPGVGEFTVDMATLDLVDAALEPGWTQTVDGSASGLVVVLSRSDELLRFVLDDSSGTVQASVERLDDRVITVTTAGSTGGSSSGDTGPRIATTVPGGNSPGNLAPATGQTPAPNVGATVAPSAPPTYDDHGDGQYEDDDDHSGDDHSGDDHSGDDHSDDDHSDDDHSDDDHYEGEEHDDD